ncbi:DNA polymerase-3 subunit alpha [Clostridium saccharoperbutylacetonicum]|uniref:DNA-directed DNA polymerase n=1 Tax=Clostridium saccharoperbutylacetonicum N1-4(HMT) TaxID=931276 RepID=M1MYR5_9CLOT|nr:DNA polymerase III subunit alpha [Clostridium saccharoperbutylacetonicum]AGF59646.1 DNA polymerase III subunit alpha [Clostridium saccharoperbutylacetonicum N1-4(HMT)]NRT64497.1 DNA polymerase-3 subunit alpha [Clostridium saccharoperbutylacetonicum]NSB28972.1 DNA polymerase-3 subunit alpha [Clostridium saccharoperbutylacetonicum]NSB46186.1 DNA polymerase-3 subunit alpha [Clostridium saccharoperbutylacetonicum]
MRYALLHNHTKFSIKDSLTPPVEYVKAINEYNNSNGEHEIVAFALTDNSNMYGLIDYHKACIEQVENNICKKLKPIYGNEIYHIDSYIDIAKLKYEEIYHLVLLAANEEGLENLYAITTEAGIHKVKLPSYEMPSAEEGYLEEHGRGIIALSGGLYSKIGHFIINDQYEEAKDLALYFQNIFDEFYLEILPYDDCDEVMCINRALLKIHKETGLPLVITGDTHYIYKEDKEYQDILKSINNMEVSKVNSHMRTPEEMISWCKGNDIPLEAVENTGKIADKCNVDITPKGTKSLMPSFKCPKGYTPNSYLKKEMFLGFKKKFLLGKKTSSIKKYIKRLNYEYTIITSMGYSSYFLILWDWCRYCKNNDILLGPGRGSCTGSLIAYCLDITNIDPVKNNLIFERFLNPERMDEPDIDTDVSSVDRKEAIEYFQNKYGIEYVCQIAAFNKYKIKSAIKAVLARNNGYDNKFKNDITRNIPDFLGGESVTYELLEDIKKNPYNHNKLSQREINQAAIIYDKLQKLFARDRKLERAVKKLCGGISKVSIHAGGVVISSQKIKKHMPLMVGSESAVLLVSQFNMEGIHYLHGLKIDVLGLKSLSIIKEAMKTIGLERRWFQSDDTNDEKVYRFLRNGNTKNIFQMSKYVATQMIRDFKVSDLDGLSTVNACNRPGPLAKGVDGKSMVDKYKAAVMGRDIENNLIDSVGKDTKGVLIYQEQLIKLGQVMAGYSLGNADLRIRKTIAKKDKGRIAEIRNEFVYGKQSLFNEKGEVCGISKEPSKYCVGALRLGFSEEEALRVFKNIETSAAYCFNKSHSYAYAFLAYKTAWLSLYYPAEYAAACMNFYAMDGKTEEITKTLGEVKQRHIKIFPPDINESKADFNVGLNNGDKSIRFGLLGIKEIGKTVLDSVRVLIKIDGPFTSFDDFLKRTLDDVNNGTLRKELSKNYANVTRKRDKNGKIVINVRNPFSKRNVTALIKAGAFDRFELNRYKLFNDFIKFRNKKKELESELLEEKNFNREKKLQWELETLGYNASGDVRS